ncbi:Rne/Rng family ribonuclease [Roseicyclus amphidinii]|uniref:Rne/Rng family ribonuclease n=1 Tax=Roseicyclus amphidinii TaxID=3034232 RepID=UPI0024E162A3|nr:Rne/Rng family ribonuclease [Roseicyclus sp. Amp-Y-6]
MAKTMLIDATHPEETRVVVADGTKVEEFDFESLNKRQLAGNIYLAKVTRVEPSLQAAFVDYGGNRHGFLAFSEIHPDYYQIPVADREALLAEEREYAEAMAAEAEAEENKPKRARRTRRRKTSDTRAEAAASDAVTTGEVSGGPSGMDVVDLGDEDTDEDATSVEGLSPMEMVAETPVEEPEDVDADTGEDSGEDTGEDSGEDDAAEDADHGEGDEAEGRATAETVADDDTEEDIRPVRKPRPRKYKIQEVVKVRQIMLVQVVKEERGNKGAALTTYLSLAGRYCVLMPNTARGGGISRKITNAADRKKLKEIAQEIEVPQGAGLIIRTAGSQRTKAEIKRDYEYLQRQWEQIRELTLKSIAPAPIYEEGNLIHRAIRDLYNRDIDEVIVEGDAGYRQAKDFMKMIMPSHAKNVKNYTDPTPLFAKHKVEGYLADMFNPTVQLKSGGYIVIGITEALVVIDVNSGRATKEGSIEETALKTNLEAAEEVARQLRLRDLAGLIVIDFIDMDERRNNAAVEKKLKDKLKTDRARIQVGRISAFGLLEMSRQRLRPGMLEATTQPCKACHGTGLIRSDDSLALSILRQLEEEGPKRRAKEVTVTAPVAIVNYLMNEKRDYLAAIEARYGLSIRIEADPSLVAPDYKIDRSKVATRRIVAAAPIVSMDATLMDDLEEEEDVAEEVLEDAAEAVESTNAPRAPEAEGDDDQPKKKRRRRRGGRGRRRKSDEGQSDDGQSDEGQENGTDGSGDEDKTGAVAADAPASAETAAPDAPAADGAEAEAEGAADASVEAEAPAEPAEKPKRKRATRSRKKPEAAPAAEAAEASAEPEVDPKPAAEAEVVPDAEPVVTPEPEPAVAEEQVPEPALQPEPAAAEPTAEPVLETATETVTETATETATETVAEAEPTKPKRRGWWSKG